MNKTVIILLGLLLAVGTLYSLNRRVDTEQKSTTQVTPEPTKSDCVPTFADGGGPYYLPNQPFRDILFPPTANGNVLTVSGKVLQKDCTTPVADAIIDIWHADPNGEYVNDWYRGQIKSDASGAYRFQTLMPKGYGEGTGYRPPHIHFKIFSGGREIITSQMFFPEIRGTTGFDDAYIMEVQTGQATHDIILP